MFNGRGQGLLIAGIAVMIGFIPMAAYAQLDDPTRPPGYRLVLPGGKKAAAKKQVTRFVLTSVFISPSRRTAIINDKSVGVGDYVNGTKVVAINPSSVMLSRAGKRFTIRLHNQVVKKSRSR